ncbi:gluconokinase [Ktedonospora formicarum]|uniref:Gluconate kinase n=1 Tax=Ktedonospora formicarum TaxID=2778364 RepID=A0A8J3I3N4_9CHLR|nr:gluconokinase [Ktedonospora formicarum]GHO44869.1 gluconate kinase [Ktedonospora formicarum]
MSENAIRANYLSPYILALDVGTSSTRALLFDARGKAIPGIGSQKKYELTTGHDGEASLDADILTETVARTIDETLLQMGDLARQIKAVALDTFWHSLVGVDGQQKALTPVITWEDTRPASMVRKLRTDLDERQVHERVGARFHASYWSAKLLWLESEQRGTFERVEQWLSYGEYLHRRLLGHSVCGLSMASGTGLLNVRERAWDKDLVAYLSLKEGQLPELGDYTDGLRGMTDEYQRRWPQLSDVVWFPALGDGAVANIGSGAASPERWALTIGTSSAIRAIVEPERVVPSPGLWLYLVDGKRAIIGGALSQGGNVLAWLRDMLGLQDPKQAETLASKIEPDGHGLTVLPFISGERSPGWQAERRMTVAGLSLHTTPAMLQRAGMEAVAYQLKQVYNELSQALALKGDVVPQVICSGGALLGSPLLQHILADTLGVPLYPSRDAEASSRGSALLALEALGVIKDVALVEPDISVPVQPDSRAGAIYQRAVERQEKLYHMLQEPL